MRQTSNVHITDRQPKSSHSCNHSTDLRDNESSFQDQNGRDIHSDGLQKFSNCIKVDYKSKHKIKTKTNSKKSTRFSDDTNSTIYTSVSSKTANPHTINTFIIPPNKNNNSSSKSNTNDNKNRSTKDAAVRQEIAERHTEPDVDKKTEPDVDKKTEPEVKRVTVPEAPPDGGFGWVVVFSSFMISFIVDGLCYSQGIFFDEFREEFSTDAATASWVGSVLTGSYSLVGPLVSALVHVYGCRRVCFIGTIVATAALATSPLSPDIVTFILTYGLATGVGFGMMYLPAIVMVGYYFERRRALATGIACCGSGMGTFLLAPLGTLLVQELEWEGATLVFAGIMLSGLVFSMFYVPLGTREVSVDGSRDRDEVVDGEPWEDISDFSHEMAFQTVSLSAESKKNSTLKIDNKTEGLSRSKSNPVSTILSIFKPSGVTSLPASYEKLNPQSACPSNTNTKSTSKSSVKTMENKTISTSVKSLPPLQRKDIFYSGDILSLDEYKTAGRISAYRQEISRLPSRVMVKVKDGQPAQAKGRWAQAFSTVFDVKLLQSPTFLLYSCACSTCMLGFYVPFTYLPLHAVNQGTVQPESTRLAFLISIIGITNVISRIAVGFISDLPCVDCLVINSSALMLGGVATVLVPYYRSYWMLALYCSVFGVAIACVTMLRSIIIVELLGLEKLTTAFGFVTLFQGAVSFVGAPIAGAIADMTGAYACSFYMAGGALFASGALCVPLRRVARWEQRRRMTH